MSLRSKIQNLIDASNETTGEMDNNLTSAVQTLIDGYGSTSTKYNVSYQLSHVSSSNTKTSITEGRTYQTVLTPDTNYKIDVVTVTMGGSVVSGAYDDTTNTITVTNVTGNISITVTTYEAITYQPVTWLFNENTPEYAIGANTSNYQCWCPHNLQYDKIRNRFIFVQSHRASHTGAVAKATMHIIHPDDVLNRDDIAIPDILGIANLIIMDNGDYFLYPKTNDAVRYKSVDGGLTWTTEQISEALPHMFGLYYCDNTFYGGCDWYYGEYHYSEDGINWQTGSIDWADEDGCHTIEHAFCFWNNHVYAFGRRNFYIDDDSSKGLAENHNDCAVVFRLDGSTWTMIDDSSLLAFQSDCCPIAFDDYIAIAHINRTEDPTLIYSLYDGQTFETVNTWSELAMTGRQQEFTSPSLAFGDGYSCIVFSAPSTLLGVNAPTCVNSIIVGTTSGKTTKSYFEYTKTETALLDWQALRDRYKTDPTSFTFLPSDSGISCPSNTIDNGNDYDVATYINTMPRAVYPGNDSNAKLVYNGKVVQLKTYGSAYTGVWKAWIFAYDNRVYAVGATTGYYVGYYANDPQHQFVIECNVEEASTQPSMDLSSVPDGTYIRIIPANGNSDSIKVAGKIAYIDPL